MGETRCAVGRMLPIKHDGFTIGSAFMSPDGKVVFMRLNDSGVSLEVQEKLFGDQTKFLSISPRSA